MSGSYGKDSFEGRYIALCKTAEHPLSRTQMNLLEQTVVHFFNLAEASSTHMNAESGDNHLDKTVLATTAKREHCSQPGRVYNIIKEYRNHTNAEGAKSDTPVTDTEAFAFYEISRKNLDLGFPVLKKKYELPETFGWESFKLLHYYLKRRGLIPKSRKLPSIPEYY